MIPSKFTLSNFKLTTKSDTHSIAIIDSVISTPQPPIVEAGEDEEAGSDGEDLQKMSWNIALAKRKKKMETRKMMIQEFYSSEKTFLSIFCF